MPTNVRISDISLYLRCPRMVYFETLGRMTRKSSAMQILIRSLMLSLSQESDLERQLRETLHRLEVELPLVYEIEVSELGPACRELEDRMASIAQSLAGYIDQLTPFEPDVDLFSERLGLSGRLDRLAPGLTPSLIRSGRAPESGIWKKDRITLAGYALLLGEKHKIRIDHGLVEYPNSGLIRKVQIHSVDRARVLRIRDRIKQIKEGRLPERPDDAPCQRCQALEICETRQTLASRFF
jgi:CRISPR-associated exonuclease Cas4